MAADPRVHVLRTCARPECLDRVHALLEDVWAQAPDVAVGDRIAFETAVAEVAANIVEHGAPAPGEVVDLDLRVTVQADGLEAVFRDTGRLAAVDVDAAALPDDLAESGRGLALARAAADLSYERDGGVNRWRVVRRRCG